MDQVGGVLRRVAPSRMWVYDCSLGGHLGVIIIMGINCALIDHGGLDTYYFVWAEFWSEFGKTRVVCINVLVVADDRRHFFLVCSLFLGVLVVFL